MPGPERAFQDFIENVLENLCGFDVVVLADIRPVMHATYGTPDLYVRHPKLKVREWIEVKAPGGSHGVTEHQSLWHQRERACGGRVWVIESAEDLRAFAAEHGFEIDVSY